MNKSKNISLALLLPCLLLQTQAAKGASQEQGGSKLWTAGKVVGGLAVLGYAGSYCFRHSRQKQVLATNNTINTIIKRYQPEREFLIQNKLNEDTLRGIIEKRHNDQYCPLAHYNCPLAHHNCRLAHYNYRLNFHKDIVDRSLLRYNWKPSDGKRFQDLSNNLAIVQYFIPKEELEGQQQESLQDLLDACDDSHDD